MEHEARLLERVADVFDKEKPKADVRKQCDLCGTEVLGVSLCPTCAVRALRDLAKELRRYL